MKMRFEDRVFFPTCALWYQILPDLACKAQLTVANLLK